ncbi:MAG: redoxin domain-containing protein [Crocinitomicaceae bacterium]
MKKIILVLLVLISGLNAHSQKFKFKVNNLKDTTVFLANYLGAKLYYADTTVSKNGVITFSGDEHQRGLYAVVLPGPRYFEFVHDGEEVDMQVGDINKMIESMQVKKSANNKVFYEYINYMTKKKIEGAKANEIYSTSDNEEEKEKARQTLTGLGKEIREYQQTLYEQNKDRFIGNMILMSTDMDLPEPPRDKAGVITDSNYVYNYYIQHYWDNVPLKDPAIVRNPVFHNKLDKYFSRQGLIQIPDTINKYAKLLVDQMDQVDQKNKVFHYTVHHITQKYESSKIMGMDGVFAFMAQNYYCEPNKKAYWMSEENLEKLCERAGKIGKTVIGNKAPMLILPDSTEENWINLYLVKAKYKVLYFWDPNCGHCKKTTPKLQTLYENKFKERGIEIYAVGKATGSDFEDWKKFIHKHQLQFINVGLTKNVYNQAMEDPRPLLQKTTLESLNYTDTYDIYSTPRIFVLDENNVIRYKQLSIAQLEEIMDKATGHEDDEKLFPIEEEEKEKKEEEEEDSNH